MSTASPINLKVAIPANQKRKLTIQTETKAEAVNSGDTVVFGAGKADEPVPPKRIIRTPKADNKPKKLSGLGKLAVLATVGATAVATFAAAKAVGLADPTVLSDVTMSAVTSSGISKIGAITGALLGGAVMTPGAIMAGVMGAANGHLSHLALSVGAVGLGAAAGAAVGGLFGAGIALVPVAAAVGALSIGAGLMARKVAKNFSPKEMVHAAKRKVIPSNDPVSKELKALNKELPVNAEVKWNKADEEQGLKVKCADIFRDKWLSANGIRQDENGQYASERFPGLEIDVQPTLAPKHSNFKWSQVSFRVPEG